MRIAVIGYGFRMEGLIRDMVQIDSNCKLTAITDVRKEEIRTKLKTEGINTDEIAFYDNADEMLESGNYDGICIGTRCSLHTPLALKVLPKGIPLYLEKPVATNMNDLISLREAYAKYNSQVVVSFPLRVTMHIQLVKEIVDSGKIGTIEHVQAVNNVPYGQIYYHFWYRDENETQGLFIQKATHDFDYINYVLGINPVRICAMKSKQIFKGNRPAGLKCDECNEMDTCAESSSVIGKNSSNAVRDIYCSFASDTGNEDSGSALIEYETGMHASYSQNFFVRRNAGKRGACFMGYKGSVEFDWWTNEIKVTMNHTPLVETYSIDPNATKTGHGGGDYKLVENFIDMMKGKNVKSVASLDAGMLSALMCIKAKESAETKTFQDIQWPDGKIF